MFAVGDKAAEAEAAGADEVGSDDLIARIQGGWLDFDAAIATPDQMAKVGRIARILGPRGLMPNPKTGTVTPDVTKAVADIKGGKINYRVDKAATTQLGSFTRSASRRADDQAEPSHPPSRGRHVARMLRLGCRVHTDYLGSSPACAGSCSKAFVSGRFSMGVLSRWSSHRRSERPSGI